MMKKRILSLILAFVMVFTMTNGAFAAEVEGTPAQSGDTAAPAVKTAQVSDFTDLPDGAFREALENAIENGLFQGSNGKINPSGNLTRAQMAAIIVRAFGATETANLDGFSDVDPTAWYYDAMQKAVAMGIFKGDNGKLNPNGLITRQQVCAVLARAFLLEDGGNAHEKFKDADGISGYAREAVAAMAAKGYIAGDASGNVNAGKPITRAQFAKLMDNLVKSYPSGTQGGVIEGNAVMRAGMNLSGVTIKGDLILADGLAKNAVDLSDCVVEGRIIVRGSSEVKLSGTTTAKSVVAATSTKLNNATGNKIPSVSIEGSSTTVTFAGEFGKVDVTADNVTVNTESSATIDNVETAVSGATVQGDGKVGAVNVKSGASDTKVTTNNTNVSVENGAGTVTSNNGTLSAGETGKTDSKGTLKADVQKPSKGTSSSGNRRPSGGSGGSGGGNTPSVTRYTVKAANGQTIGTFDSGTTLTVKLNGGGTDYTVTVSGSTTITNPSRTGYTFNGWTVSSTTITAQWTKNTVAAKDVQVKDSEGRPIGTYKTGTVLSIDPANEKDKAYTVIVAENTVITVPTREGYTFARWLPVDKTVTASWTKNPSNMTEVKRDDDQTIGNFEVGVTLTIDPNNGSDEVYTVKVEPGLVITTPKKDGWHFVNWLRDPLTTLTAQWSETPVEVGEVVGSEGRFIANHPIGTVLTVNPDNGTDPYTVTVEKKTIIERPARDGYDLDRWKPIGNTITALWIKKAPEMTEVKCSDGHTVGNFEVGITLTVDPANDKDKPYTVVIKPGLVIQHPVREGYKFKEWNRNPLTTITAVWTSDGPVVGNSNMIYDGKQATPILMDASYPTGREHAYEQVARAVGDLRQDIAMVDGAIDYKAVQQLFDDDSEKQAYRLEAADQNKIPQLSTDANLTADYAIIVGTAMDSKLIQDLIAAGKLSGASVLTKTDAWESYTIQEVENPTANIKKALVIAGADPRGTIFGIYTISEQIGVSPWYWYSDVPVKTKSTIDVDYSTALVDDGPDVKYRGIFINDEEYSNYWARGKFPEGERQPGVNYYRRLFEVILRMKGNTMWPAMHKRSVAFFTEKNAEGLSINGIEAAKYGIVVGSSHCEIFLRNNVGEWGSWIAAYNKKTGNSNTSYSFFSNKDALLQYWRERLIEVRDIGLEGLMTIGLRGVHDGDFSGGGGNKVEEMKYIIREQRALVKEVFGREDAVAQMYIAYDHMGTHYNNGVKDMLAEEQYSDIMISWANDSYGYLRQTPNDAERARQGGCGIYYHISYMGWGGSRKSYLFLDSLPIQQMNEQMNRAYKTGMKDFWILNVGDLKPGDILANYFLDMGWDMAAYPETGNAAKTVVHNYLKDWCVKQYNMDTADAENVASAMEEFYNLTNAKKTEFFGAENGDPPFDKSMELPFSVIGAGDEGQRIVDRANEMVSAMKTAYDKMDDPTKAAFYQQMYSTRRFTVTPRRNMSTTGKTLKA